MEFTATWPNARLLALAVSVRTAAFSVNETLFETPFACAVSNTDRVVATDETEAVVVALVAPAGTVTVAGTAAARLLLVNFTV